jgi:hypothetical protein
MPGLRTAAHSSGPRLTVAVRRREKLGWIDLLSLGLHLDVSLHFLIVLPEPLATEPEQEPQGKGSSPSIAITAEGVKQPTPSRCTGESGAGRGAVDDAAAALRPHDVEVANTRV